jgi:hypothetical protein
MDWHPSQMERLSLRLALKVRGTLAEMPTGGHLLTPSPILGDLPLIA